MNVRELYDLGWLQCSVCGQWTQEFDNVGSQCPSCESGILGRWLSESEEWDAET